MSNGAKIALTLLGLSVAGGAVWYFATQQPGNLISAGGATNTGGSTSTGSQSSTQPAKQQSPYEGKTIVGSGPKTYLVEGGTKRWITTWATYQAMINSGKYPARIKISDTILNSIPDGISI